MCQGDLIIKERKVESEANGCMSARGDVRWVVRMGLLENLTLGQRPGGGEEVSHVDEWRRMFSDKGEASDKFCKVGGHLAGQLELSEGRY